MEWWVGSGAGREREGVWKERSRLPHQPARPAQPPQNRAMKHGQQVGQMKCQASPPLIECPQWHSSSASRVPHKRTHNTTQQRPTSPRLSLPRQRMQRKNDRPLDHWLTTTRLKHFSHLGIAEYFGRCQVIFASVAAKMSALFPATRV